jgi:ribonuclease R
VDFDLPEPQILLDVEGAMTGITIEPRNRAHRLIEEFMLAANEAVAAHLERKRSACLYRVHEPPDPVKLEALASFVAPFGLDLEVGEGRVSPRRIQHLLEQAEALDGYRVIGQVALRSMKQARYATDNVGHFGLAAPSYCHFTSPIRRYPDLVVHRLLRAERRRRPLRVEDAGGLEPIAAAASELERKAEAAERELLNWKKIVFIAGRVGETFDGIVTGVTRFGLFVQLVENLVEGLVRVERLGAEWFEFRERRFELAGSRTGKTYRLGDRLRVRVDRVDRVLLRVELSPAEPAGGRRTEPGRARGDRRGGGEARRRAPARKAGRRRTARR